MSCVNLLLHCRELHTQAVVREMKKKEEEERRIAKLTAAKEDARRRYCNYDFLMKLFADRLRKNDN